MKMKNSYPETMIVTTKFTGYILQKESIGLITKRAGNEVDESRRRLAEKRLFGFGI
jgi:hypothetical protein